MRLAAALLLLALAAPAAAERRFALAVGHPDGGAGTRPLRYAERDARRIRAILTRLGGVREDDALLLLAPEVDEVRGALAELAARSGAAREAGERTLLVLYYSGHAKDGALRLGAGRLPLDELRRALEALPADVRVGIVDACGAGALAGPEAVVPGGLVAARGLVVLASSAATEDSQESDATGGGAFTHHLASGLLGGADASGDGRVTVAEAFAHASGHTTRATSRSGAGVQHPVALAGPGPEGEPEGEIVLTELSPAPGALAFGAALEGRWVVLDRARRPLAELWKEAGAARRLALAEGRYTLKKDPGGEGGLLVGDLEVGRGVTEVDERRMRAVPREGDPQRGTWGARWSLLAGGGLQRPLRARDGAAAGLAGLELLVRDDLGHRPSWGIDLALGRGRAARRLAGGEAPEVRVQEISAGASLWRDLRAGPFGLAFGGRVGALLLSRTLPDGSAGGRSLEVAPGLVAAASWALGERWSAVLRLRGSWLVRGWGRAEGGALADGLLGVEYLLAE